MIFQEDEVKISRTFKIAIVLLGIVLLAGSQLLHAAPGEDRSLHAAWQAADARGGYEFTTSIQQTAHPLPKLVNVGLGSKTDNIYIDALFGYTVTDFGYMDGKWRALTSKETGVFHGDGVLDGRTSFSDLSNRTADLNAVDKRVLDIEYIGGRWYLYARKSDDLGASGLYSRNNFSDFSARTQELKADGKFLVDMEIVDGKFYGLVVNNG